MGMTTFAIANVFWSFTVKDDHRSMFSSDTFADRKLLMATGLSALAILFGVQLGIFERILGTVSLTGKEWIVCILAASTIIVATEIRKLVLRRRPPATVEEDATGMLAPVTP
jgi:Ca2+-transporting ATPase